VPQRAYKVVLYRKHPDTLLQVAPMSVGRIAIRYRQVECAPPADLRVQVDQNAGPGGWLRLLVEVRPLPILLREYGSN
jgi:hypothetical protein